MTPDDDLVALVRDDPRGWVAHWWVELDREQDPHLVEWLVGELDGRPAGLAATLRVPAAAGGRALGIVTVMRRRRHQGVGSALLAGVEHAAAAAGLSGVQLSCSEGDDDAEAAVRRWGLREVARHRENVLELSGIDRDDFVARAAAARLELSHVGHRSEQQWQALYEFFSARWCEAPDSAGGGEAPPYSIFRTMLSGDPWSVVTATEGDRLVGVTCVSRRPGSHDVVNTFFTGVEPSVRGRGVATALKCHQALLMADAGMSRLHTQNMDGNEPILAANRTLGFVAASGYIDVVRDF